MKNAIFLAGCLAALAAAMVFDASEARAVAGAQLDNGGGGSSSCSGDINAGCSQVTGGTHLTGVPAATALTGTVPVANGGTGNTLGFTLADSKIFFGANIVDPTDATWTSWGLPAGVNSNNTGSNAANPGTTRNYIKLTTGATNGNAQQWVWTATTGMGRMGWGPFVGFHILTDASIASVRIYAGPQSGDWSGESCTGAAAVTTKFGIIICYDTGSAVSSTNWLVCLADGAHKTCTDSGVSVATATDYSVLDNGSTGTSLSLTISGTVVGPLTTNIPPTTQNLGLAFDVTALSNSARAASFSSWSGGRGN